MKPLDPQIRRLLDEVTSGDLPPAHLEEQVWQQLAPRLGGALPPTAAAASSALAAKSSTFLAASPLLKLSLGALIAGASVTAVVQHRSDAATHEARSAESGPGAAARDTATPAEAVSGVPSAAGAQPSQELASAARAGQEPVATGRGGASSEGASSLVAETQLLARAQRALRNGKPAVALPLIEQHATAYPEGALAQERDAARVLALCALQRSNEARRSQQQFLKTWPGSPLTERVQRACTRALTR
jgi:hypothetical protein